MAKKRRDEEDDFESVKNIHQQPSGGRAESEKQKADRRMSTKPLQEISKSIKKLVVATHNPSELIGYSMEKQQ